MAGLGPQRYEVDIRPGQIKNIDAGIAIDRAMYLPCDPIRKRSLMIAFGGGTRDLGAVRRVVEHFQNVVEYYEPRHKPNGGSSGADFVKNELIPFYNTVQSVKSKQRGIRHRLLVGRRRGTCLVSDHNEDPQHYRFSCF